MTKKALTEKAVAALKPAPVGKRYSVQDSLVPGLEVRITDRGTKTFMLGTRYPGSTDFKRRELAKVGAMTLAAARERAREWLALIGQGIDPSKVTSDTFAAVAENYIKRRMANKRNGWRVAHQLKVEVLPNWGERPIGSIARRDVRELIQRIVDRPAPRYAHNVYDAIRGVFTFALVEDIIAVSPTTALRPRDLIGERKIRERVLDDDELRALWHASEQIGYPFGPLARLLLLTGARVNELAQASWQEIDLQRRTLTVPAERFKMNSQHVIHLSDDAMEILSALPRWSGGDYVFSTLNGAQPVRGFGSRAKANLNHTMGVSDWVIHDLRRVVRSRLAELRVVEHVAEMVIGHSRRGLQRVYDQYRYKTEIAEALQAWARHLRAIVRPPPRQNVVPL
jgi:integrase